MFANEQLRNVCLAAELTIQQLAEITGYSTTQAFRWVHDLAVVPIDAWHSLYRATDDARIPALLGIDDLEPAAEPERDRPARRPPAAAPPAIETPDRLVPGVADCLRQLASCVEYVARIVSDGFVREADDDAINGFFRDSRAVGQRLAQLRLSLAHWRQAAGKEAP